MGLNRHVDVCQNEHCVVCQAYWREIASGDWTATQLHHYTNE